MGSFHFKQFTIQQDKTAMKVGTDSILLGSWLNVRPKCNSILDVGTGTGLLALMMAQKTTKSTITALEMDLAACHQAEINIKASPWKERIKLISTDARQWSSEDKFDLIISNPPYFSDSILSKDASRKNARHQVGFDLNDLVMIWCRQGSEDSELACVLPVDESKKMITLIESKNYSLKSYLVVQPKPGSTPNRAFMLFSKEKVPTIKSELCIYSDKGVYTKEYITLTEDFYLGL
ncbi:MAG: methyltransferase [Flavobacteriales bacterium]|nr:methyltransferase [Flavobacteriales bacterium]